MKVSEMTNEELVDTFAGRDNFSDEESRELRAELLRLNAEPHCPKCGGLDLDLPFAYLLRCLNPNCRERFPITKPNDLVQFFSAEASLSAPEK